MKNEIAVNNVVRMSSTEIAELTNKLKKIIHRDIWVLITELYDVKKDGTDLNHYKNQSVTVVSGVDVDFDERGYIKCFWLDRYHTEVLVTGYDVSRRAAVIKRLLELAEENAKLKSGASGGLAMDIGRAVAEVIEPRFAEVESRVAALENKLHTAVSAAKTALPAPKKPAPKPLRGESMTYWLREHKMPFGAKTAWKLLSECGWAEYNERGYWQISGYAGKNNWGINYPSTSARFLRNAFNGLIKPKILEMWK